jgi:hypothetical protein
VPVLHAPTAALSTVTHRLYRSNSGAPSRPNPQGGFLLLARSDQDGPRQGQALLLAARQLHPPLTDLRVIALRQLLDELVTWSF